MSLHPEMCHFTNRSSSSVCIMVLLKLNFVFLWAPFLYHCCIVCGTCVIASIWDYDKCRASRGTSYVILCMECCPTLAESKAKCSDKSPTFKPINEVHALTIEHSVFSVMAGLIVEILFMLLSIYNAAQWAENEWIWSVPLINSWMCNMNWLW